MRTEPTGDDTAAHFDAFHTTLESSGTREALAYLLSLSDYRFIGIFRLKGGYADAAVYYDREHPEVEKVDPAPDTVTYCCYVHDSVSPLLFKDSLREPRFEDHVARSVIRSYCGIPIMDREGNLPGTLCQYDNVPRDPDRLDLPLLLQVASTPANGRRVPPYLH